MATFKRLKFGKNGAGVAMIHPVCLKEVLNIHNDLFWNIA